MKVTGQHPPRSPEIASGKAREADARATRKGSDAAENPGQVRRQTALVTQKLREAVRAAPDVRADKVAEVKERIKAGTYKVNPDRLAGAILNESLHDDLEKP